MSDRAYCICEPSEVEKYGADPKCQVGEAHGNHPPGSRSEDGVLIMPRNGLPSRGVLGPQVQITKNTEIKASVELPRDVIEEANRRAQEETTLGKNTRPSWDEYFLGFAKQAATRGTCDRKQVGAVVTLNNRLIATGYNGSPKGMPHCDDVGHTMKEIDGRMSCVATIHAECNALGDAKGLGDTVYVTVMPCFRCAQMIVQHGITRVVYGEFYNSQMTSIVSEYFDIAGVELVCMGESK